MLIQNKCTVNLTIVLQQKLLYFLKKVLTKRLLYAIISLVDGL